MRWSLRLKSKGVQLAVLALLVSACQNGAAPDSSATASGGVGATGTGSAAGTGHAGTGGTGRGGSGGGSSPSSGGAGGGTGGASAGGSLGSSTVDASATDADATSGPGSGGMGGNSPPPDPGASLRIYWIDAEGGAATLMIGPGNETLLADTGWAGARDVGRIVAVLDQEIGQRRLDYFLATHYHDDHVGGAPDLAAAVKIGNFIDHGATVESGGEFDIYRQAVTAAMSGAKRITAQPGMTIMLGPVAITIASAAGKVAQLPSASANPACAGATITVDDPDEDPQSVGFVARWGKFDFVDLGDLTAGVEHLLACPSNQLGAVDLFQASQHGSDESNAAQLLRGLAPQVIVVNNGADKGGDGIVFDRCKSTPGVKDVWSLHRKTRNSAAQNADEALTANTTGPDLGHFIRATVKADGSFSVTNGRTNQARSYTAR
jgi:competence protein ComEC